MINCIKAPAALTACFVIAAACSSSPVTESAAKRVQPASVATTDIAMAPQASPIDLKLLAALANTPNEQTVTTAQKIPAVTEESAGILPAKTVTFSQNRVLIPVDRETAFKAQELPIILDDSDLLEGTVYDAMPPKAPKMPKMTPGTYRTIEYKK